MDDKIAKDLKQDQFDIYYTLSLGWEIFNFKNGGTTGGFDFSNVLGIRWYPKANNRFGLYGEVGYTPIS